MMGALSRLECQVVCTEADHPRSASAEECSPLSAAEEGGDAVAVAIGGGAPVVGSSILQQADSCVGVDWSDACKK